MDKKTYNEFKSIIKMIEKLNKEELKNISILIDEIIRFKISDENTISQVFDRMLSLEFINEEELKELYFKLLDYTKNINKELSDDYKEIYEEKYIEEDIKVLEKNNTNK